MTLTRLSDFNGEAVLSLADAKAHLAVRHDDEDALISGLRDAAVQHIERVTGVALAPAEFRWETRRWGEELPMRPVTAILSVTYRTADGTLVPYEGATTANGWLESNGRWPAAEHVVIEFAAGDMVLPDLRVAAAMLLGHLYDNRTAVGTSTAPIALPLAVESLIQPHRRIRV